MTVNDNALENILAEVGDFGKYQRRITALILLIITMSYFSTIVWLFETKQVNYRCEIANCESDPTQFKPSWWSNAIPSVDNNPAQCLKYHKKSNNSHHQCSSSDFDKNVQEACDGYVYETSERSIMHDFDLHCEENLWKLTLVGTLYSVGLFIGLPVAGVLSDKYGRKSVFIVTMALSAVTGVIRSFTNSYPFFMAMEFLDSIFSAGTFPTGFILAVELVGPSKRVLVGIALNISYAVGGIIAGGVAWLLLSWRPLLQVLYAVQFIVLAYYWLIPESVRWLLAQKRFADAENVLIKLAKTNGKTISDENLKILHKDANTEKTTESYPIKDLVRSFTLTKRFINCSIIWLITIFVYQGMTINAIALSSNSYLDTILSILVEIPAAVIAFLIMDRIGRRFSLSGSFIICAVSCISFILIPEDIYWLRLCMYLLGKLAVSIDAAVIYTVTTEIFPTPFRNSLMSACSMFGRIGSMVAPQIPLLEMIWKPLPLTLFGATSVLGCVLCLLLPETMNTKLPDTIVEAENIGKKTDNVTGIIP